MKPPLYSIWYFKQIQLVIVLHIISLSDPHAPSKAHFVHLTTYTFPHWNYRCQLLSAQDAMCVAYVTIITFSVVHLANKAASWEARRGGDHDT